MFLCFSFRLAAFMSYPVLYLNCFIHPSCLHFPKLPFCVYTLSLPPLVLSLFSSSHCFCASMLSSLFSFSVYTFQFCIFLPPFASCIWMLAPYPLNSWQKNPCLPVSNPGWFWYYRGYFLFSNLQPTLGRVCPNLTVRILKYEKCAIIWLDKKQLGTTMV